MKDEMINKILLKRAIQKACMEQEMDKLRIEIQTWKEAELE